LNTSTTIVNYAHLYYEHRKKHGTKPNHQMVYGYEILGSRYHSS
jgi:hypothetical protein